jgi:tetratricopeptide (TPR) repeat protein
MSRLEQLQKLVHAAGDDPLSHYGLALEYLNLERWDEAAAAFAEALRLDANYSAAYYHKARAEIGGKRPEAARETLTKGMAVAEAAGDWKTRDEMRELMESIA